MTTFAREAAVSDLRALQEALNGAGATPPLSVTGQFCPATRRALIAYQTWHGLLPDGVAGPKTLVSLGLSEPPEWPLGDEWPVLTRPGLGTAGVADEGHDVVSPDGVAAMCPEARRMDERHMKARQHRSQLERELALLATALHRRRRDFEGCRLSDPAQAREIAQDASALLAVYRKKSVEMRRASAALRDRPQG